MKKKERELSEEDILEMERMEEISEMMEDERQRKEASAANLITQSEVQLAAMKDSFGEFELRVKRASGVLKAEFDQNGRQLYAPDSSVFDAMNRNWVSVVGRNGEYMSSALEIYEHFDLNLPAGERERLADEDVISMCVAMRKNFIEQYTSLLNSLVVPSTYAKFKGIGYPAVLHQIKEGEHDMIEIDGIRFILMQPEDMNGFEDFLMRRAIAKDCNSRKTEHERLKVVRVWEAKHKGKKCDVVLEDTVRMWMETTEYHPCPPGEKSRDRTSTLHADYRKWCKYHFHDPLSRVAFTERMVRMGFKQYRGEYRGFYYYQIKKEESK
jgi:hypothetical protein